MERCRKKRSSRRGEVQEFWGGFDEGLYWAVCDVQEDVGCWGPRKDEISMYHTIAFLIF
jgi:hypothetical protein